MYHAIVRMGIKIYRTVDAGTTKLKINAAMFGAKRAIRFITPKRIQKRRNGATIIPNNKAQFRCL